MAIVCRIISSKNINRGKYVALEEQAALLGDLRKEIWQRFGSLNGVGVKHRDIRNRWIPERDFTPLAAKAWKETLRDTLDDIKLYEASAKEKVRKAILLHTQSNDERKRLYKLFKGNKWPSDPYLCRMMRQHKKHGKTNVKNQIIVEDGVYRQFTGIDGCNWLKIPSLVRGKMICIPLNCKLRLRGCLRIILKQGCAFVHHTIPQKTFKKCGSHILGVDKGYSEAFVDSDGNFYGQDLGALLTRGTEERNVKGQVRNKLHQIAKKKPHKAAKIKKFNLGRKKLEATRSKQKERIRDVSFQAVHRIVDRAKEVRAEDLSHVSGSTQKWKKYNRLMSGWAKGSLAEALESVTQARGSCLRLVNCAYTSQMDSNTGRLEGRRVGDKFHHVNGDVSQADINASVNIKHRGDDTEITLYTPFQDVKRILLRRLTENGGVSNCDRPSMTLVAPKKLASTESELPNHL